MPIEYDDNGNRLVRKDFAVAPLVEYGYDFENRLVALDDSAKGEFAYTYDSGRVGSCGLKRRRRRPRR